MKPLLMTLVVCLAVSAPAFAREETQAFGRFGIITLYTPSTRPQHVVLFVSGDGG